MLNKEQFKVIIDLQKELDAKISETRAIVVEDETIISAKFLALIVEISEFANEIRCFKYWSSKPASSKNILLEEYIDGFHFITSIARTLKLEITNLEFIEQNYQNLNLAFLDLFAVTLKLEKERTLANINQWFNVYYTIGKICQFSSDEIFNSYLEKNQVNHLRQEQNY